MASTLLRGHFYIISIHGSTEKPEEPIFSSVRIVRIEHAALGGSGFQAELTILSNAPDTVMIGMFSKTPRASKSSSPEMIKSAWAATVHASTWSSSASRQTGREYHPSVKQKLGHSCQVRHAFMPYKTGAAFPKALA